MFNREFEVLLANAALVSERYKAVTELIGNTPEAVSGGGSVWLRRCAS
jgi:hypothetical protein